MARRARGRVTAEGSGYAGIRAGQSRKSPLSPDVAASRRSKGHLPGLHLRQPGSPAPERALRTPEGGRRKDVAKRCCKGSCASVESPVAGPPGRNDEWTARNDGGPSVRTRVEPEGHRRAPPPVLKAPRRRMWGFSLPVRRSGNRRWVGDSARRRSPDDGRLRRCGPRGASAPRSPRSPRRTHRPGR